MDVFLIVLQYVGAVSFAISATIYAVRKRTDIIGALVFSLLTCFGGGFIRDMIIGRIPPNILVNKEYYYLAAVCIITCIVCYHLGFIEPIGKFMNKHQHSFIIEFTDALGLASFVVLGVESAIEHGKTGFVLLVFAGCITGAGGGILRDICAAEIPSVFRKHIYLIPVIIASCFLVFTYDKMPKIVSIIITIIIIITIRMLAFRFKWNLPIPKVREESKKEQEEREKILK
ncbi:MAG: trimeric intracellular cation channel family protein [Clostridia bacterium]|nr:trimeric intracellular cation channel family protein [Clostridia bacterium]